MEKDFKAPTQVYLVRHAEVESNYQKVFGGRIDMGLSANGHAQAEALAAFFDHRPLDVLYASPMRRTRQTIGPLLQSQPLTPVFLDGLREVDFGIWTGLSWDEVRARFQMNPFAWLEYLDRAAIPNAENTHVLRERVEACLDQVVQRHPGQSIGLVCHGGVIRMALSILLRLPLIHMAAFAVEYASITRVDHRPDKISLQLLNLVPWRDFP